MVDASPGCKGPRPRGTAEDLSGSGVGGRCARSDSIRATPSTVVPRQRLDMRIFATAFADPALVVHRRSCEVQFGAATPGVPCPGVRCCPNAESRSADSRTGGPRPPSSDAGRGAPAKVGRRCDADLFPGALALVRPPARRPCRPRLPRAAAAGTVDRLASAPRQREPEQRAAAGRVLDGHRPAVRLGHLAHDREAEARARPVARAARRGRSGRRRAGRRRPRRPGRGRGPSPRRRRP